NHFGIDTSNYSFGYIAAWSSDKELKELKNSLDTIQKTASKLISDIETVYKELQMSKQNLDSIIHDNEIDLDREKKHASLNVHDIHPITSQVISEINDSVKPSIMSRISEAKEKVRDQAFDSTENIGILQERGR
ncbi:MAG: hypothetical protein GX660_08050, partial [Clostridiaceae bacterium]|nr:hypothetical protein [Clostridiaceae bacterium]